MKPPARVQLDKPVISAGSKRGAAAMVVRVILLFFPCMTLINIVSFTGHHHPTIKEEPKSLTQPVTRKHNAYSTTNASSIRHIESTMGFDFNPPQPTGKHHK